MAILPGAQHPASGLEADAEGRAGEETALRRFWGFRGLGPALGELEAEVSDDSTSEALEIPSRRPLTVFSVKAPAPASVSTQAASSSSADPVFDYADLLTERCDKRGAAVSTARVAASRNRGQGRELIPFFLRSFFVFRRSLKS